MNGICSASSSQAAVQGRRRGESGPLWPHTLVCPPSSHQIISVPRTRSTLFFITCLFISKSSPLRSVPASRAPPCRLCGRGGDDGRVKYTRREHGVKLSAASLSSTAMLHFHCLRCRSNYQIVSGPPRGCFLQTLPHSRITVQHLKQSRQKS